MILCFFLGVGGNKLLGVPYLPHLSTDLTGNLIANATVTLLDAWKCRNSVYGMVFDTTSSNTGHKTAACIAIQRELDVPLLWLACRHHVGEVVLGKVWDALSVECSKSPNHSVFQRFQNKWEHLPHSESEGLHFPKTEVALIGTKEIIVDFCEDLLKKGFIRCDYKELAELTLLYLTGDLQNGTFTFKRPGALHKARWMAKLLYSIKMVILSEKINQLSDKKSSPVFKRGQLEKIKEFVKFSIYNYVPWWFKSPIASSAPYNDMMFINAIMVYSNINDDCSNAALKGISNHLWYLTEELVPLSLFSNAVDDNMKQKMANKLLSQEKQFFASRHGNSHGKPNQPAMPSELNTESDLTIYVGPSSWSFFQATACSTDFMYKPVTEWENDHNYIKARHIVENMAVVNDAAERGVKLCHDFLDSARKEDRLQDILQVVENDRSANPNQRRKNNTEKKWYLKLQ